MHIRADLCMCNVHTWNSIVQVRAGSIARIFPSPNQARRFVSRVLVEQGSDSTKNTYSTPNSEWRVIDSFESGQVIEMDVVVVYYHRVSSRVRQRRGSVFV